MDTRCAGGGRVLLLGAWKLLVLVLALGCCVLYPLADGGRAGGALRGVGTDVSWG